MDDDIIKLSKRIKLKQIWRDVRYIMNLPGTVNSEEFLDFKPGTLLCEVVAANPIGHDGEYVIEYSLKYKEEGWLGYRAKSLDVSKEW